MIPRNNELLSYNEKHFVTKILLFILVLQTANFKVGGQMQLEALKQLQPNKPAMVMEFWTGWFDHWDEPVHNTWSVKGTSLYHILLILLV